MFFIVFFLLFQSCAVLFSGFLQAVIQLLYRILINSNKNSTNEIFKVIKTIIQSRPMLFVTCETLRLLRKVASTESTEIIFCKGSGSGNLKLDYDQGVLLYKKGKNQKNTKLWFLNFFSSEHSKNQLNFMYKYEKFTKSNLINTSCWSRLGLREI